MALAVASLIERYRRLRSQPMWSLLAADTGSETIACLQVLLYDTDRRLAQSVFAERLLRLLNAGSLETVTLEAAQKRIVSWRDAGYVVRHLEEHDTEPYYELSVGAFEAIRFIAGQNDVRISPTESRLELLIHAFKLLVDDSDGNTANRVRRLQREKRELDARIKAIQDGRVAAVSPAELQAQIYDILSMIEALDGDFLRVRAAFEKLAEGIHADLMSNEQTRGKILEQFFAGYDAIAESDEGRTFTAFYKFLSSDLATREIEELVTALESRAFWQTLQPQKRDTITDVRTHLNARARQTQKVMKRLASSLRFFVQSREYLQNRRLAQLIEETRTLSLKAHQVKAVGTYTDMLTLDQSFASVGSIGTSSLFDPDTSGKGELVQTAEPDEVDLMAMAKRLSESEINYTQLRFNILSCLAEREAVTIADVLASHPARQGLASIVGYIHLAVAHAEPPARGAYETLVWTDRFGASKQGRLPKFIFLRGCFERP